MKLVEINWDPSRRQLRQFGVICFFALPLIGWIWNASMVTLAVLGAIGFVVALTSLLLPQGVKPLFVGLSVVAIPIGMVIAELALLLIFLGVFVPMGLVFRMIRRDALQRHFDQNATSYWQPKKRPHDATSYYRQF